MYIAQLVLATLVLRYTSCSVHRDMACMLHGAALLTSYSSF